MRKRLLPLSFNLNVGSLEGSFMSFAIIPERAFWPPPTLNSLRMSLLSAMPFFAPPCYHNVLRCTVRRQLRRWSWKPDSETPFLSRNAWISSPHCLIKTFAITSSTTIPHAMFKAQHVLPWPHNSSKTVELAHCQLHETKRFNLMWFTS